MDLVAHSQMKFVVMSFDAGTGLPEHAVLGDAMIFALAGASVIRYEGINHPIKASESFKLAKSAHHAVTATDCFKMALFVKLVVVDHSVSLENTAYSRFM
ncbi:MAG: hypothetical protein ACTIAG_06720 [Lactobacillus sp.]